MIYFDYSATTPVNEEVLDTYVKVSRNYIGNPNSLHKLGVDAKKLIDAATNQIATILNVKPSEVIYTSGASESNNMVIKGVCERYKNRGKHIITTKLEHSSIIAPINYLQEKGFEVDFVDLDDNGQVDLKSLKRIMRDDTILVSICSVNSEVGVVQPIDEIARIVKEYPKAFFHSDMTQTMGKQIPNLENIDFVSFSAQKFYGLKGVGCLIKKENIIIEPLIHGGKSTTIYRSGTPATPLVVSLAKALRLAYDNFDEKEKKVTYLHDKFIEKLKLLPVHINSNEKSLPYIINLSLKNIKPETMLHALEQEEIYISTQTACSKGDISDAVYAVTKNIDYAKSSIRISISHLTTEEEIDKFIEVFSRKLKELEFVHESR